MPEETITAPVIRWEGEVAINADEHSQPPSQRRRAAARQGISSANGPARQTLIVERGAERGFSNDQLHRAKRALGIRAFKQLGQPHTPWFWALPQDEPAAAARRRRANPRVPPTAAGGRVPCREGSPDEQDTTTIPEMTHTFHCGRFRARPIRTMFLEAGQLSGVGKHQAIDVTE